MDNKFERIICIENFVPMFLMLVGLIAFVMRQFHRFFMSHSINVFLNFLLLSIGLFTHCGITFFRKSFELKNIKE